MAKGKGSKPPKGGKGSTDWMTSMMSPTKGQFMNWVKSQKGQFNPAINTLNRQLGELGIGKDWNVRAAEAVAGSLPSQEDISSSFDTASTNIRNFISGVDNTVGSKGVSNILGAIGGGIGAGAGVTADIAGEAGTISGVSSSLGNLAKDAIFGGVMAQLQGTKTQALSDASKSAIDAALRVGQTKEDAARERRGVELQLADVKGRRRASSLNPLDIANSLMSFQQNQRAFSGYGGGGSGGGAGGGTSDQTDETGLTGPEVLAAMAVSGKGAHAGLGNRGGSRTPSTSSNAGISGYPGGSGAGIGDGGWAEAGGYAGTNMNKNEYEDYQNRRKQEKQKSRRPYGGKDVPRGGIPGR